MKLNIINLIDNFNKFNNYVINPTPISSHKDNIQNCTSCIDFLNYTQNCLIFENKPLAGLKLFNILLEKGKPGIIISRHHPVKIGPAIASKQIDLYWLSTEDFDYVIHPWDINLLLNRIENFVLENSQGIVLLQGLEYLSTYNNIHILFGLIFRINKIVANTDAKFFITIDPIAIGNQFLNIIKNNSEIMLLPSNPFKEELV